MRRDQQAAGHVFRPLRPLRLASTLAIALIGALGVGLAVLHAGALDWSSRWRDRDIMVDGVDEDWQGQTLAVKGQHFSLGIVNDGEALYMCLPTKDRSLKAQIARGGLIVWFERTSGKKGAFGVHFPVGMRPEVLDAPSGRGAKPDQQKAPEGGDERDVPTITQVGGQDEIEVLGPKKDDVLPVPIDRSGIAARIGVHDDLLVFELKVPLRKTQDLLYAIGAEPGEQVRVDIRTPEWRGPLPQRRSPIGIGVGVRAPGGGGIVGWPGTWDASLLTPLEFRMSLRLAHP